MSMMLLAWSFAIRSIADREAVRPLQMIPVLISFLYGLGVAEALVLTAPLLSSLSGRIPGIGGIGDMPLLLPFLGLGLAPGRRTAEREPGRWPAFSVRPALLFVGLSPIAVWLLPALARKSGATPPAVPLLAVLCAVLLGLSGGRMLRSLVLYVGGRRTSRMHLWIFCLAGAAAAPLLSALLEPIPFGPTALALGTSALMLCGLAQRAVRSADMPVPDWESWRRGPFTSLGVLLIGAGCAGLFRALLLGIEARGPAARQAALALPVAALFVAGAVLSNVLAPRLKRAGVRLGAAALLAAAAFALVELCDRRLESVRLLFLFGLPALLLGLGLAVLPRLYGGPQMGDKIMWLIPLEERRGPVGGAWRVGLFLLGGSVGWPLFGSGGGPMGQQADANGARTILSLAIGGLLLVVFDPQAGIGRKLMTLTLAGGAALFGAICYF